MFCIIQFISLTYFSFFHSQIELLFGMTAGVQRCGLWTSCCGVVDGCCGWMLWIHLMVALVVCPCCANEERTHNAIIIQHHSSSFIIIHHQSSSVIISHHQSSSVIISHHQSSSVIISHHHHS
jgi:hypothetical protein